MKRIFCDRCGEEIDYKNRSKPLNVVGEAEGVYDLCPQCMVDFGVFMRDKPQAGKYGHGVQSKKMGRICGINFEE
jgi:hypothetical protein|nr:MAG TPA: cysteine-rich protein [Caudoviricetes sp.]